MHAKQQSAAACSDLFREILLILLHILVVLQSAYDPFIGYINDISFALHHANTLLGP